MSRTGKTRLFGGSSIKSWATSQPSPKPQDPDNDGVAEDLYANIIALFTKLIHPSWRGDHKLDESLAEQLGRLFLWGEDFRDGKLDMILESYADLRLSIVKALIALGKALINKFTLGSAYMDNQPVTELISKLKKSIHSASVILSSHINTEDGSEAEFDSQSETSESEDDDESLESIQFYISLLMNLVPAMEHAYRQTSLDLERYRGPLLMETSFLKAAESSKSEASHQSETSKSSLPRSIHPIPAKEDAQTSSRKFSNSWVKDLRVRFEQMLKEKPNSQKQCEKQLQATSDTTKTGQVSSFKGGELSSKSLPFSPRASSKLSTAPPPYEIVTVPKVLSPPFSLDVSKSWKQNSFCKMLTSLASIPLTYENPGLIDEALSVVPLHRIYNEAQDETGLLQAKAGSMGEGRKPEWGYQDCVTRSLMRWFRSSFFTFVNNPPCPVCGDPTTAMGLTPPIPDETAYGARRVELYQCSRVSCSAFERFPRYEDPWMLLRTRRGRAGEWVNCFSLLCRAAGAKVRWVWNEQDHVWTEVYSDHQRRWVHIDPCEGAWDCPTLYTEGWGRRLSYCIAFSVNGPTDVTRRYVRDQSKYGLPRTRASEDDLYKIIKYIRSTRREKLSVKDTIKLIKEDLREEKEFQRHEVQVLVAGLLASPSGNVIDAGNEKLLAERGDSPVEARQVPRQ